MVIPFGFSVSDFTAGVRLLRKVTVALHETNGASSDYSATLLELEGLLSILQKVQGISHQETFNENIQKLKLLAHQSFLPLSKFFRKIQTFEADLMLGPNKQRSILKFGIRNWRKLEWGLYLKRQIAELKVGIGPQLTAMELVLQLISLEQQVKSAKSQERFQREVMKQLDKVNTSVEIFDQNSQWPNQLTTSPIYILKQSDGGASSISRTIRSRFECQNNPIPQGVLAQSSLSTTNYSAPLFIPNSRTHEPRSWELKLILHYPSMQELQDGFTALLTALNIGFNEFMRRLLVILPLFHRFLQFARTLPAVPTMLLSSNIIFDDALGRKVSLPYEHFRHFPVFMARLQYEFKGLPGEEMIVQHRFVLHVYEEGRSTATKASWNEIMKAGLTLKMVMVINKTESRDIRAPYPKSVRSMNLEIPWEILCNSAPLPLFYISKGFCER